MGNGFYCISFVFFLCFFCVFFVVFHVGLRCYIRKNYTCGFNVFFQKTQNHACGFSKKTKTTYVFDAKKQKTTFVVCCAPKKNNVVFFVFFLWFFFLACFHTLFGFQSCVSATSWQGFRASLSSPSFSACLHDGHRSHCAD